MSVQVASRTSTVAEALKILTAPGGQWGDLEPILQQFCKELFQQFADTHWFACQQLSVEQLIEAYFVAVKEDYNIWRKPQPYDDEIEKLNGPR
jgi:hypothetical protein